MYSLFLLFAYWTVFIFTFALSNLMCKTCAQTPEWICSSWCFCVAFPENGNKLQKREIPQRRLKGVLFLGRISLVISRYLVKIVRKPNGTETFNTCFEDFLGIVTEERRDCQLGRF